VLSRTRVQGFVVIAIAVAGGAIAPPGLAAPHHHHGHKPHKAKHKVDGKLDDWRGQPTMLAGHSQISRGELIYTDYLYDDYGPDLNGIPDQPQFRDLLAPKSGDYAYPDDPDRYGYNAADLRELRFAANKKRVWVLVALQTMQVPDAAVVMIAIDTDGDASTGTAAWPGGAGLNTQGADSFVTTWGSGAQVTDASGDSTAIPFAANLDENAIELKVPRRLLGPVSPSARVWAASGLANPDGTWQAQSDGETAAFDVAFQGDESYDLLSHWGDRKQSRALAEQDVSGFAEHLQIQLLKKRRSVPFVAPPGYYNRIFRSNYTYGEGIDLKGGQVTQGGSGGDAQGGPEAMFRGRYQPYGLYLPDGYQNGNAPLLLDGHSLDVNHNEYAAVGTHQLSELGEDRGSVIITPLARGIDTWYLDSGLVDVFEAWKDAREAYRTDEDRTSITGYSMGGYMTYRLGLLMPDAFARASVYVGPPAYYFWPYPLPLQSTPDWEVPGNTQLIVDNGLNLPFEINGGNLDELVPIAGVQHQVDAFQAAGDPFRFYHHATDDHFSFIVAANEWSHTEQWLGDERRDLSPVRVRYVRYPSMDLPRAGLVFDGAYWVDGMQVRDADAVDDFGKVNARTFTFGEDEPTLVDEGTSVSSGQGGVSPATVTGQHYLPGPPIPQRNAFEATLTNLSGVTFLTDRLGLDPRQTVDATLTGDGSTVVKFTGRWRRKVGATLDGSPVAVTRNKRQGITLTLDLGGPGSHQLEIR